MEGGLKKWWVLGRSLSRGGWDLLKCWIEKEVEDESIVWGMHSMVTPW